MAPKNIKEDGTQKYKRRWHQEILKKMAQRNIKEERVQGRKEETLKYKYL